MTPRERVMTALRRQEADCVPYEIGGFNREAYQRFREETGMEHADGYFGVETHTGHVFPQNTRYDVGERFLKFHDLPPENYRTTLPPHPEEGLFTINEWGTAFVVGSVSAYDRFVAPAFMVRAESVEEMEAFPTPDFGADYRHTLLQSQVEDLHAKDLAVLGSATCTLFERAWQIRGLDRLLMDFVTNEDMAHFLLDRELKNALALTRRYARAGVDILYLGDDVSMQDRLIFSPDVWRRFFRDRMRNIIDTARSIKPDILVMYHSDGSIEPLIPDLIEIGIDILNPVQPECMDPAKIKREYGQDLAFWGTIGIQHTLPFGTPEEVAAEVKLRIETVGKGGGLFLCPTHCIAPEVPHENIFAFVSAVKKYGGYE